MYTRVVSFTAHPNHADDIKRIMRDEIGPALREQPGFVDFLALEDIHDSNRRLSVTFWKSKSDADRYGREVFPKLIGKINRYFKGNAEVHEYNVDTSTFHHIAEGKAA